MRLYDITTGTGDFVANGVVSHNRFARPTHKYLDFDAGRDFEREIVVKVIAPEVLRVELARASWKGEHVAMGTNTDPYQWVEGRYKLMRGIWEALRDAANPCSVLTKSPLLLRDLDLMREIAAVTAISANVSVPTIDEKAWRASEPHTPNPRARLDAVAELNRAGIPTCVLVAPLMPGINDDPRQVQQILELAAEAGATGISGIALHLRGEVREIFMEWLRSYRPDLVEHYEQLYAGRAYAPQAEQSACMHSTRCSYATAQRVPPRSATRRWRPRRRGPVAIATPTTTGRATADVALLSGRVRARWRRSARSTHRRCHAARRPGDAPARPRDADPRQAADHARGDRRRRGRGADLGHTGEPSDGPRLATEVLEAVAARGARADG